MADDERSGVSRGHAVLPRPVPREVPGVCPLCRDLTAGSPEFGRPYWVSTIEPSGSRWRPWQVTISLARRGTTAPRHVERRTFTHRGAVRLSRRLLSWRLRHA